VKSFPVSLAHGKKERTTTPSFFFLHEATVHKKVAVGSLWNEVITASVKLSFFLYYLLPLVVV